MSKKKHIVFLALAIGLVFCLSGASALFAQESGDEEFTLEEITVTAQKRAENQQKVAIAMEVVSADEIKELGKNDIDEILSGMSNTIIEKAQEGYRVTIRGITDNSESFKGQSMAPPAVAVNMDGVFSNRKDTGSGLFDIERVEVLYGPQSTMYASNSPGGIVNVVTANPKTDRYEGSGSLEYGNFNLLHTEGAMNAPLNDKVAIRASFSTSKRDGYLSNGADDEDVKSARLRTLYQPSDKVTLVVTGEVSRNNAQGFGSGVKAFDTEDGYWMVAGPEQGTYIKSGKVTDPWTANEMEELTGNNQIAKKLYAQANVGTSAGTITMTPSYTKRHGSSSFVFNDPGSGPETSYMTQNATEKGQEVRLASPEDFYFKFLVGATYYNSYDRGFDKSDTYLNSGSSVHSYTDLNGVTQTATFDHWGRMSDREMTNKSKAFFLNITYPVTNTFRATAGYRQSWDRYVSDNEEMKGSPALPAGEVEYSPELFIMENNGKPDYKLGIEYDVGANSMLYADYATSYRVQGMGGGPPGTKTTYEPERLKAYTIGAKNRFLGNKLQVNAAAYYYDYSNYRAGGNDFEIWKEDVNGNGVPDPGRDAGELFPMQYDTANVGDGRMIGVDLSLNAILTQSDRVNLTASYMKSEWTDLILDYAADPDIESDYEHFMVIENGEIVNVYMPYESFNGKPMMSTPPWNINLTYDHNFTLANGSSIKAGLTVKYKTAFDLSWRKIDYPLNHQKSYHMEDLNVVYNNSDGKWNFSVYVKNLTNYAEKRSLLNMAGSKLLTIGNPRTYGGVLSVKF